MLLYVRHAFSRANEYAAVRNAYGFENVEKHIAPPHNLRDADLTEQGIEQSKASGAAFRKWLQDNYGLENFEDWISSTGTPRKTDLTDQERAKLYKDAFQKWRDENPDIEIEVIISPMMRAVRTASLFLNEIGYSGTVILDPVLREKMIANVSDMGTEKTPLLEKIRQSSDLLSGLTIDQSEMTKEIWYNEGPETFQGFNARIEEIREKYIKPAERDPKKLTLIFAHHGIGVALSNPEYHLHNTEIVELKSSGAVRPIYTPPPPKI